MSRGLFTITFSKRAFVNIVVPAAAAIETVIDCELTDRLWYAPE